ncbi:MAG: carboxypeptidase-like regulatory domain-containing protein [Salibacteraceae bacterium]
MSRYQLQIKEPCHEDWSKMLPQKQGRFCQSCSKTVVDFTSSTDARVLDFFKNKNENTCGRFSQKQIDQIFVPQQKHPWIGPLAGSLSLLSMVIAPKQGQTQDTTSLPKTEIPKNNSHHFLTGAVSVVPNEVPHIRPFVSGRIWDENEEPLAFSNVMIYHNDTLVNGIHSDFDGVYKIEIPIEFYNDTLSIRVSYAGYPNYTQVFVPANQVAYSLDIQMVEDHNLMGDVVIIKDTPWRRFKRWCSKLWH